MIIFSTRLEYLCISSHTPPSVSVVLACTHHGAPLMGRELIPNSSAYMVSEFFTRFAHGGLKCLLIWALGGGPAGGS